MVFVAATLLWLATYFIQGGESAVERFRGADVAVLGLINLLFFLGYLAFMQGVVALAGAADANGQESRFGEITGRALRASPMLAALWLMEFIAVYIGALFIVVGIIILIFLYVAGPAMVIEKLNPFEAFGRSVALTENHRMTLFGLHMTQALINVAFGLVVFLVIGGFAAALPNPAGTNPESFTPQMIAGVSVAFLAYLFLVPLWLGVNQAWSTSAYIELKTIKEGGPNVADAFS